MGVSCKNLEGRRPITQATDTSIQAAIENNKELYAAEEAAIEEVIANQDRNFERGATGFYYSFVQKDSIESKQPTFGDRLTFTYDVTALDGSVIYTQEEIGTVTKSMEQEYGIFRGMREALKLMQEGEEMIVYFPSYAAYGYYGDNNRIGVNVPFRSQVKLMEIKVNQEEEIVVPKQQ